MQQFSHKVASVALGNVEMKNSAVQRLEMVEIDGHTIMIRPVIDWLAGILSF